jgi:membrane protein YdbS with pleckstrin-like domain
MGHLIASIVLALIGALVTHLIGYDNPWPWVVAAVVFLLYWGVSVLIIDDDWF